MTVEELIIYGKSKVHSDLAKMLLADLLNVNSLELLTYLDKVVDSDIVDEYKKKIDLVEQKIILNDKKEIPIGELIDVRFSGTNTM